ncbi:MAG: GntR family transcriptional regulator [Chitinivibrionales bacterium]|nr:GntR family transcriptional regulator [Chitinivibrionales bacterium]
MPPARPGQQRAIRFLHHCLLSDTDRLPPIATLARQCGVAYATMWKAVRTLRSEGLLNVRQRRGIQRAVESHTVHRPVDACPAPVVTPRWQAVLRALQHDLASGAFAPGALIPTTKQLQARYGVSYATMRKALAVAVKSKQLAYDHRRYRVPTVQVARDFYSMPIITRTSPERLYAPASPVARAVYHQIEGQCTRRSIVPRLIAYHFVGKALRPAYTERDFPFDRQSLANAVGIVLFATGLAAIDLPVFIERLSAFGKPIALLDEYGMLDLSSLPRTNVPLFVCRTTGNIAAGRRVARDLLALGHRKVAFVTASRDITWSRERLHGIREVYRSAGGTARVTDAGIDEVRGAADLALSHQTLLAAMRPALRRMDPMSAEAFDARQVRDTLGESLRITRIRRDMATQLDRLIDHEPATAWVAANERTAIVCLDHLRSRGIRVPGDLSMVSFDDTIEASFLSLSSYTFNSAGMADALLSFLLRPRPYRGPRRGPETAEIDGRIVMRHSLAAVARR